MARTPPPSPAADPAAIKTAEFSRPHRVAALPEAGVAFSDKATRAECAALAARYGVLAVRRFSATGDIRPEGEGWRLRGVVRARIVQTCVVTLEPVEQIIEEPFSRLYLPGIAAPDIADINPDPDVEDPPEPLPRSLDPGEAAAEVAALAIDPYPRAESAEFRGAAAAPEGVAPMRDEETRPFAGLAALRDRIDGGESQD